MLSMPMSMFPHTHIHTHTHTQRVDKKRWPPALILDKEGRQIDEKGQVIKFQRVSGTIRVCVNARNVYV